MWRFSKQQMERILGTQETLVVPEKIDVRKELERRKTLEAKLLFLFKNQGEITTRELRNFGTGCSSRLFSLRREGHLIKAQYEAPGQYRYVYLGQKDEEE